jgi:hypothetical protein
MAKRTLCHMPHRVHAPRHTPLPLHIGLDFEHHELLLGRSSAQLALVKGDDLLAPRRMHVGERRVEALSLLRARRWQKESS